LNYGHHKVFLLKSPWNGQSIYRNGYLHSGPYVGVSWFVTAHGFQILAVASHQSVEVYSKQRLSPDGLGKWGLYDRFDFVEKLVSIAWLHHGELLVSTISSLHILKCVDVDMLTSIAVGSGRLVDHHPVLLTHYLVSGRYEQVKANLSILHLFVKHAIDIGSQLVDTPTLLWKLLGLDLAGDRHVANLDDYFDNDTQSNDMIGSLSKKDVDFLVNAIPGLKLSGLNADETLKLVKLIKAFFNLDQYRKSCDDNGVRFLLPALMTLQVLESGEYEEVNSRDATWAFFSDSQDTLLETISQSANGKMVWKRARALGFGWWIKNPETLVLTFNSKKRHVEAMARNQFLLKDGLKDPTACSLFYLALRKKNVLHGLWKLSASHPEHTMMTKFLANDFDEERWQSAALKNAFALLGKQRYGTIF
jgi:RAVE protein 1 C terminal